MQHPHPGLTQDTVAVPDTLATFKFIGDGPITPDVALVDGMVSTSNVTLIAGQSSAGKTFAAILLLCCLATQTEYFGRKIRERVGVLYIAGEGQGGVAARFAAALDSIDYPDPHPPIAWMSEPPPLDTPQQVDAFIVTLRLLDAHFKAAHGVRLGAVVVDTVAACFEIEKEESNAEINKVCKRLKRLANGFGGVAIAVHHFGKDLAAGPRGASAWRANSEFVLAVLAKIDQATGEVSDRALAVNKARDGAQGPVAPFALEAVMLNHGAVTAYYAKPDLKGTMMSFGRAQTDKTPRTMRIFANAYDACLEAHGESFVTQNGVTVIAVDMAMVLERFKSLYAEWEPDDKKRDHLIRQAIYRIKKTITESTYATEQQGSKVWLWNTREA
jgi:hypothetical protein